MGTSGVYGNPEQIWLVTREKLKGWVTLRFTKTSPERVITGEEDEKQSAALLWRAVLISNPLDQFLWAPSLLSFLSLQFLKDWLPVGKGSFKQLWFHSWTPRRSKWVV